MSNQDKGQQDNIDLLVERQETVLDKVTEGIQGNGITVEDWTRLRNLHIPEAARGHLSQRTARVLEIYTRYGLYRKPKRLLSLDRHLRRDFDAVQRLYVNKGLLTLSPRGEIEIQSSLSGETPVMESQLDYLEMIEQDESEGKQ